MAAHSPSQADTSRSSRDPVRTAAAVVGGVFLLVGVLGFVPGITTNFDDLQFAGHESESMLLGIFQVSILHNIVHLLFGVAGVAMARNARLAELYLVGGGITYFALFVYGLIIDHDTSANFVPVNNADNWLHLLLAIGMVGLGVVLGRRARNGTRHP